MKKAFKSGSILKLKKNRSKKKQGSRPLKIIRWFFWGIVAFLTLFVSLTAAAIYLHVAEDLPEISSLRDYRPPLVTTVWSDDHRKIAEFYRERRIVIPLSKMPKHLIQAFIASEDSRFFEHRGVDYMGITRAFLKNVEAGSIVQGGSTITQQVIKPFLSTYKRKSYKRKLKEAILAYRIEKTFTKEEILWVYLNEIYLGYGSYGVEAAAGNYFGKSAKDLNLAECAVLAGLPKSPIEYSPSENPEKAKERQAYVLGRMVFRGYITNAEAAEALNTKLEIKPRQNWYKKTVPYYTEHIRRHIEKKLGPTALYEGGLQIHTAVNIEMQKMARKELEKGLRSLERRQRYRKQNPQGALVCIEAGTGHVKAMVGGRDFQKSQLNRAFQSKRQPGSAFKPIIYAAALDKGFTPVSVINDSDVTFWNRKTKKAWRPRNYDKRYYGPISFRKALAKSRNIPAVKILKRIGVNYAADYARTLGIRSPLFRGLPLALGASCVSLTELVTAFSVFTNLGERVQPVFITKILDRDGNEIQGIKTEPKRVIEKSTAYIMTNLLESVVKEGTGRRVRSLNRPAAGKTGTSSNLHDAWFVGYTPEYVTGVWVGFDKERSLGKKETGSRAASPIWLGFMKRALAGKPVRDFHTPEGVVFANNECFKKGTVPIRPKKPEKVPEVIAKSVPSPAPPPVIKKPKRSRPRVVVGRDQFFKSSM